MCGVRCVVSTLFVGLLVVGGVPSSAFLSCHAPLTAPKWKFRYVVDVTESMGSELLQVYGEGGIMQSVMTSAIVASPSFSTVLAALITFQDKRNQSPFGESTDDCHDNVDSETSNPSVIGSYNIPASGGGDPKNCQLQAIHREIVSWSSVGDEDNVFVLLTDSKAHTAADGPPGLPPTPDTSSYNTNDVQYPEVSQIDTALNAKLPNSSVLIIVAREDHQQYYRELFKESGQTVVVTYWRSSKEATREAILRALDTAYCGVEEEKTPPNYKVKGTADFSLSAFGAEGGEKGQIERGQEVSSLDLTANGKVVKKVRGA